MWSNDNMRNAIEAVGSGEIIANKATSVFEVPPTTLKDRLLGWLNCMEMYFNESLWLELPALLDYSKFAG